MSLVPTGLNLGLAAAQGLLNLVLIRPRSIGPFVADVTIEEIHRDRLTITRHPVEQGAAITDHSFKEPAELTIRCGFSNSSLQSGGDPNYVQQIYSAFLAFQASREIFDVITGKRAYNNMLIQLLQITTDERSENSLMMLCECREVILATTQIVAVGSSANMANPQLNGATQNMGTNQLVPGSNFNASAVPQ